MQRSVQDLVKVSRPEDRQAFKRHSLGLRFIGFTHRSSETTLHVVEMTLHLFDANWPTHLILQGFGVANQFWGQLWTLLLRMC
jgi:hypothetical protein